jgi:hypothetical protein
VWHAQPVGGWVCYRLVTKKNYSGVSQIGWMGMLQISIKDSSSNVETVTGQNRCESGRFVVTDFIYLCAFGEKKWKHLSEIPQIHEWI